MDFTFYMPTQVISGPGCLSGGGDRLRAWGRRCLIVTGGSSAKASGALDDALAMLKGAGIEAAVFPGIGPNPLLTQCQAAAAAAEACKADFLLGIGGGSVMDASKAAAWLAANSISDEARLFEGSLRHPPLPLALVGTTAGTGSEVTAVAVLTVDRDRRKRSVTHPHCYAKLVFADPRYTYTVPYATTVSTALDALSHAVEGWFAPACGDVQTLFAEKAIPLLADGLAELAAHPGELPGEAGRQALYYASLDAGMVLNATGTAFPHPFGYILTEDFGVPHGMACAVFLPALTKRAESASPERAARLFELCGGRERYYRTLAALATARVQMTEEQIEGYSARWPGLKNFARTPGGFTPEEGVALFRELFLA